MIIAVVFDCYAKLIECDNLDITKFPRALTDFTDWLYVETKEGYLDIKESLNIQVLDITVVLRFFEENYPECNARVVSDSLDVEDIEGDMPVIAI